ncbi:NlpC/P60 family protein [Streptomyces yaizuensis]|uniref:NlpC/P60 family protein n=1 Tax=Streptomyces yaizuensis TaxID=2989713 RepID=A0ABQ5P2M7_9ACTN|nr:NlpC/P60 family protein [Streptomyces sp. YSPA8]GLF96858.1 NlpC/P60 family protein [Streptomyces sp. YSPA8]
MVHSSGASRRSFITALAAGTALPLAGAPLSAVAAPAPTPAPTAGPPVQERVGPSRTYVTVAAHHPATYTAAALGPLTVTQVAGAPALTHVSYDGGPLAVLTQGSRTVVLTGPERTFREDKRAVDDIFDRTIAEGGWGLSPGGGAWETANGVAADYRVTPGTGVIRIPSGSTFSRHVTMKDNDVTDLDTTITARFDKPAADGPHSFALTFGYEEPLKHHRARLVFSPSGTVDLHLEKSQPAGVTALTQPARISATTPDGASWCIRVDRTGDRIRARAWRSGETEPTGWQLSVQETAFPQGRIGIRADSDSTGLPVHLLVSRVRIASATWNEPVTVTHRDWVRVLPQPFSGTWDAATEQRVRQWAGSTAPDALAYAFMFLPGAPTVMSHRDSTTVVLGEADYGPPLANGARELGADFHEFMEVDWTFPGNLKQTALAKNKGCLDCSGYVRMVYGYHLGVGVAHFDDTTSPDLLPRTSAGMAQRAPGVRIAHNAGAKPSLTGLRVGDLVFFDAEDTGNGIDHVGIYLGRDSRNNVPRFLSSRKTPNGPTAADLGGDSTLEGTGTYATTLRTVHRI